ncbi:MAG TPA: hypothetical protein VGI71_01400 [Scandinavium sp.]|jgi:hypothetical protein
MNNLVEAKRAILNADTSEAATVTTAQASTLFAQHNSAKTRAGVKTDAGKSTGKVVKLADAPKPIQESGLLVLGNKLKAFFK